MAAVTHRVTFAVYPGVPGYPPGAADARTGQSAGPGAGRRWREQRRRRTVDADQPRAVRAGRAGCGPTPRCARGAGRAGGGALPGPATAPAAPARDGGAASPPAAPGAGARLADGGTGPAAAAGY